MALCRKRGTEEDEIDGEARGAEERRAIVGGSGQQTAPANLRRTPRFAEVETRAEARGEGGIPGDHERYPPRATEPSDARGERGPTRDAIVAEDHARQALRQAPDRGAGVGEPSRVGEEPEHGEPRMPPRLDRPCPSDEPLVHGGTG